MVNREPYDAIRQAYLPPANDVGSFTGEQEQVLLEHLPTVRRIARHIHDRLPSHVDYDDMVSSGVIGLMDAVVRFDPQKDVKFETYAQFRIRGAILDSLRDLDWGPRELRRRARNIETAIGNLTMRLGRPPEENEIAAEVKLSLGEYRQVLCDLKGLEIGSLHVQIAEGNEELIAYVPSGPEDDPLFHCLRGELEERLKHAIAQLPGREAMVISLCYVDEMTLRDIARVLNVCESRVSQIRSSAILHLRAALQDTPLYPAHHPSLESLVPMAG